MYILWVSFFDNTEQVCPHSVTCNRVSSEYPQYIEEINEGKSEVIELYQKYKNKEILLQIIELEKKVSNLQKKLIK